MLAWIRDLDTAREVNDVLCLARRCVEGLPPHAMDELPDCCRTHVMVDTGDLRWWSERLSEEYWRRRGLGLEVEALQDAWSFFLRASIRVARLSVREPAVSSD